MTILCSCVMKHSCWRVNHSFEQIWLPFTNRWCQWPGIMAQYTSIIEVQVWRVLASHVILWGLKHKMKIANCVKIVLTNVAMKWWPSWCLSQSYYGSVGIVEMNSCAKYEVCICDSFWAVRVEYFTNKQPFKLPGGRNCKIGTLAYTFHICLPHTVKWKVWVNCRVHCIHCLRFFTYSADNFLQITFPLLCWWSTTLHRF